MRSWTDSGAILSVAGRAGAITSSILLVAKRAKGKRHNPIEDLLEIEV
jgi:hypothetical protein